MDYSLEICCEIPYTSNGNGVVRITEKDPTRYLDYVSALKQKKILESKLKTSGLVGITIKEHFQVLLRFKKNNGY